MRIRSLIPALVLSGAAFLPGQESLGEYQALARMVRHFLALVTWPTPPDRPLTVAVLGGESLKPELEALLAQGTVGGRKASVRFLSQSAFLASLDSYDAVFLDREAEVGLSTLLAKTRGRPILVMGYGERVAHRGGMVGFYLEEGHFVFDVNQSRLKEARLIVNPRLLRIAKVVED